VSERSRKAHSRIFGNGDLYYGVSPSGKSEITINTESGPGVSIMLSLRASVGALRCPLYDGGVSVKARRLLASGNIAGAFEEYHRLAELGSGKARCVIAYANLLGTRALPKNSEEAGRIARSAITSEPGFSNYILGCIAMQEEAWDATFRHFNLSSKAGFLPALSTAASLSSRVYRKTNQDLRGAETVLFRAIRKGHVPALLFLAAFYTTGSRGFPKRLLGIVLSPLAIGVLFVACRVAIFSPRTFFYDPALPSLLRE
jgi:hypothetical protein